MGNRSSSQLKPQKESRTSKEILSYSNATVFIIATHGDVITQAPLIVPENIQYFSTGEIGTTTSSDYDRKIASLFSPQKLKNTLGYFTGLYGYFTTVVPTISDLYFKVPGEEAVNKNHKISKFEQQLGDLEGRALFGIYTFDKTNGELIKPGNKQVIALEDQIVNTGLTTREIMNEFQRIYPGRKLILVFLACSDIAEKGASVPYSVYKSASGVTAFSVPPSSLAQKNEEHPEETANVLENFRERERYTQEIQRILLPHEPGPRTRASSFVESASAPTSYDIWELWQKKGGTSKVVFQESYYMPNMAQTRTLKGLKAVLDIQEFKKFLEQLEAAGYEVSVHHTSLTPERVFSSDQMTLAEFLAEHCQGGCCSCRRRYSKKTRGGAKRRRQHKSRTRKSRR